MKHTNAQTVFIVENCLFLLIKEKEMFNYINTIKNYDIGLKIKKPKEQTVPLYFYILLKDRHTEESFKINININEKMLKTLSSSLDFVENIVFVDQESGKMTKAYKINKFLKKNWNESIKALQEIYLLKKMLREIR
ncbi:MAG: hypothetical protein GXO22_08280 [Aquificae bacterium]|nr:hypothetical protein [Aquificota bacterium]